MKCMEKNKQPFYYALLDTVEEVKDEYGNMTGEKNLIYKNPVRDRANISADIGETSVRLFGDKVDYDKVMEIKVGKLPIDEYSILWIDTEPLLDENGALVIDGEGKVVTPHDFEVRKVGKSLNVTAFALRKVDVGG